MIGALCQIFFAVAFVVAVAVLADAVNRLNQRDPADWQP